MEKKYIISEDDQITIDDDTGISHTLHRIIAARDFDLIKKGDLGGYIETEDNLSHSGNCWIFTQAKVCGNTKICDYEEIQW